MKQVIKIAFVLSVLWMTGCASLLVANPGTRQAGSESRSSSSDTRITNAVNAALVRERDISSLDIYVSTYHGVVTLKGYVGSAAIKDRAHQVTASCRGVKSVRNQLRIR